MAKRNSKQTSKRVASKASKILNDGRYSKKAKSVAGSALSRNKTKQEKVISEQMIGSDRLE